MRKFKQIYIEITNICNLNCSFCPKNSRPKRFMTIEEFEKAILIEERKILLHRAMKSLKPEHRQILYLVYFEDFSVSQAAEIMKKSLQRLQIDKIK